MTCATILRTAGHLLTDDDIEAIFADIPPFPLDESADAALHLPFGETKAAPAVNTSGQSDDTEGHWADDGGANA